MDALKNIKLVVSDVDGVLTDDTIMLFVPNGGERKEFELHANGTTLRLAKENDDSVTYFSAKDDRIEGYSFYTPDGIAVRECIRYHIPIVLISGRRSPAVEQRAKDLGAISLLGVKDKVKHVENLLKEYGASWQELLFIGNDVQDLSLAKKAGFSAAPNDCAPEIRDEVDYVATKTGGKGAFREILQKMFGAKGLWQEIIGRDRTLG